VKKEWKSLVDKSSQSQSKLTIEEAVFI